MRAALQIAPLALLLVWLEPRLAAVGVLALGSFSFVVRGIRKRLSRAQARALEGSEELVLAADEAVRHADVWKVFGAEEKAKMRLASIGRKMGDRAARVAALGAASSGLNEVLAGIVLVALVVAARAGWLGDVRIDRLLPFVVTFFLAYKPLRDLAESQLALSRARAAWTILGPIVHGQGSDPPPTRDFVLAPLEVDVLLPRGASKRVSLRIPPGHIVVVRGPTGIGKTTLLRVLLGLEAPREGSIRYDGQMLDAPAGRARPFAWVPQEAPILADSLDANVRLGSDAADVSAVLEAIGAAHLHDDVKGARLGPSALSGGERQLVAIARALATDRPVLLLDEPTSGLDAHAQAMVLSAIETLRGKRSVLVVTHRPEPLAIADDVIDLTAASPRVFAGQRRSTHALPG
jgi:ABC-type multidrug transport system fused ATPase/permease subunit